MLKNTLNGVVPFVIDVLLNGIVWSVTVFVEFLMRILPVPMFVGNTSTLIICASLESENVRYWGAVEVAPVPTEEGFNGKLVVDAPPVFAET